MHSFFFFGAGQYNGLQNEFLIIFAVSGSEKPEVCFSRNHNSYNVWYRELSGIVLGPNKLRRLEIPQIQSAFPALKLYQTFLTSARAR